MILIGSVAQQFLDINKMLFTIGACCASFVWFFCISYGAKLLSPIMKNSYSWRIFNLSIAIIMFSIAIGLAKEGKWF